MKQKDIATIVFIVGLSAIASVLISNKIISTPKNRQQKVEIVESIGSEFTRPNDKIFNDKALNPTQIIRIGNDSNDKPFNSQ